jgi:DNA-directed RNA polymerase specialized sigma24 family protein
MFRWKNHQNAHEKAKATAYATRRDFKRIFSEDMAGLHLLAFLLTADADKAEQCFVAGLESSIDGNAVFRQWARSWSKRAIIKNAIKILASTPGEPGPLQTDVCWTRDPQGQSLILSVTRLDAFERFVLVMTVLESYSVRECAALLSRSAEEVMTAKSQALQGLGSPSATPTPEPRRAGALAAFLVPTELA